MERSVIGHGTCREDRGRYGWPELSVQCGRFGGHARSKCKSEFTYEDGDNFVCPECAHEWTAGAMPAAEVARVIKDANGNVLKDSDTVTVIKDLKVKASSLVVKVGTKVKSIRPADGGHDIDCKIDGIGSMGLKFVKKMYGGWSNGSTRPAMVARCLYY